MAVNKSDATRNSDPATSPSSNQSVERALDLLEAVVANGGEDSAARLAKQLGLAQATTYRLLSLLDQRGYLRHVRERRTYSIGPQALVIGETARQFLGSWAEPVLADLASQTGETANLAVLEQLGVVYVAQVPSPDHRVRIYTGVGQLVPAHSTAVGKAMLAFAARDQAEDLLNRTGLAARTRQTITGRGELMRHLDQVRDQGYAVDDEEEEDGVRSIAAPVILEGEPRAAVSISAPRGRLVDPSIGEKAEFIRDAAQRLSRLLEGVSPGGADPRRRSTSEPRPRPA